MALCADCVKMIDFVGRGKLSLFLTVGLFALTLSAADVILKGGGETAAGADSMPFWGGAASATNRTSVSTATAAPAFAFNSRGAFTARAAMDEFTSARPGLMIILR